MSATVLQVRGLTKRFGGLVAVDAVDFDLATGELHAIIGPNGAGKTTLFNLISGFLSADMGEIVFEGKRISGLPPHKISRLGVARTLQVKSVFDGLSVHDNVWIAAHSRHRFLHPLRSARSYKETASQVERVLEEVGLGANAGELAGNLSYGDVALLEIAIALATRPKLLLLDEPVAGMSPSETERTVNKIRELAKSLNIILVEHDMEVVFSVADRITVMHQGALLCQGAPDVIAKDPRVQEAYLGSPAEEVDHA